MKKFKLPRPTKLTIAALGSFWIADIVNSGFNPIGIMIFLLIPILLIDLLYPQEDALIRKVYDHKKAIANTSNSKEEATDEAIPPAVVN